MTTHELAKILIEMPDVPVKTTLEHEGYYMPVSKVELTHDKTEARIETL